MKKSSLVVLIVVTFLMAIVVDCVTPKAEAARRLTPEQERIYQARVAERRQSGEIQRRKEEAERRIAAREAREKTPSYKRKQQLDAQKAMRQHHYNKALEQKNKIELLKRGKNSEDIVVTYALMEVKKAEVKKLLKEIKSLQDHLSRLVTEKIRIEPNNNLTRLLTLSDPNYIDDPNVVTIDIVNRKTSTPVIPVKKIQKPAFNSAPVETKKEAFFIDLKARN